MLYVMLNFFACSKRTYKRNLQWQAILLLSERPRSFGQSAARGTSSTSAHEATSHRKLHVPQL